MIEQASKPNIIKLGLSRKHTKFEKNLPHGFDKSADLLSKRQNYEKDFFKVRTLSALLWQFYEFYGWPFCFMYSCLVTPTKYITQFSRCTTLQMFAGIYGEFIGKSECEDFKFMGISCYPQSPVILKSPHSDFHVKIVGI